MEKWNAYMDVLFAMQGVSKNAWILAAFIILLIMVAVLIAAGFKVRHEGGDEAAGEERDETAGAAGAVTDSGNVNDKNANVINMDDTGKLITIVDALGGPDNIYDLACSDTRLRVTVNDGALVNRMRLKTSGALGVLAKGRKVQVFYEKQVECICRELERYIEGCRCAEPEQEEVKYERVLKKVYVPVEGDVVCVSDIHCLQNLGDRGIGVCAVRAARGEIRAPFDCKAGYSKTGDGQIECVSKEGYTARIFLIADGMRDWKRQTQPISVRLKCAEWKYVRKGELIAEYPYETYTGMGDQVYVVIELYVSGEHDDGYDSDSLKCNGNCCRLRVYTGENVNYEYTVCEIVE